MKFWQRQNVTQQIFLFSLFPARRPVLTCPQKSAENAAEKQRFALKTTIRKQRFDPENNDSKQRFDQKQRFKTTIHPNNDSKTTIRRKSNRCFGQIDPLENPQNNDSLQIESLFLVESLFSNRCFQGESLFFCGIFCGIFCGFLRTCQNWPASRKNEF